MTERHNPYRPGVVAIVATVALSSTAAFAQDMGAGAPVVAASPPVAAAPAAVAAPAATVQAVPDAPRLPQIDTAAAVSAATGPADAKAPMREERESVRSATVRPAPAPAPVRVERQNAPVTTLEANDVTPRMIGGAATARLGANAAPDRPATVEGPANLDAGDAGANGLGTAGWLLMGGGIVIVAGGAAVAMRRRRRQSDGAEAAHLEDGAQMAAAIPARETAILAATPRPAAQAPAVVRSTAASGSQSDTLERMVAEAPSEANPFRTRRQRLRRAEYLLRTGQADAVAAPAEVQSQRQGDRWSEMSFAGRRATPISWKPARG